MSKLQKTSSDRLTNRFDQSKSKPDFNYPLVNHINEILSIQANPRFGSMILIDIKRSIDHYQPSTDILCLSLSCRSIDLIYHLITHTNTLLYSDILIKGLHNY